MPEYRVTYQVDVEADSPLAAAREGHRQMTDPAATLPILGVEEVIGFTANRVQEPIYGEEQEIDLQAEDDYDELRRHDALDRN